MLQLLQMLLLSNKVPYLLLFLFIFFNLILLLFSQTCFLFEFNLRVVFDCSPLRKHFQLLITNCKIISEGVSKIFELTLELSQFFLMFYFFLQRNLVPPYLLFYPSYCICYHHMLFGICFCEDRDLDSSVVIFLSLLPQFTFDFGTEDFKSRVLSEEHVKSSKNFLFMKTHM